MANIDAETVLRLAPREWRPTIATAFMCIAMVSAYFIFFANPISNASAGVADNKKAIGDQQKLNSQIERRLGAIEGAQNATNQQLGALQGAVNQQAENQKLILQFLLTGQRPSKRR